MKLKEDKVCGKCGYDFPTIHHFAYHYREILLFNKTCEQALKDAEPFNQEINEAFRTSGSEHE